MPDVDFPIVNVSINYDGAAPEVVETELVDAIEERLLTIEGIKEMRSTVQQGAGSVNLEFDIKRNVDVALQEVQSALSQLRLPIGIDPAVVRKTNPEEDPIMFVSIYGNKTLREMIIWINNYLMDQLQFLPGVGEVNIAGYAERNLRIWPDPEKLKKFNLTIVDVLDAISSQHLETAAGQYSEGKRELRVRWLGEATSVQEVEAIHINRRGGQVIYDHDFRVRDVAKVEDGLSDIRRMARVNGEEAISIAVKKQRGTNEVSVAKAVRAKLEQLQKTFPEGLKYRINVDFTRPTEATVNLTIEKLWVAALVTIFVCFLFLGSLQAAINILFSIPTSIVGTFIIVYFAGFTLNIFTLLALTLAISIVVDDAIMLLENIVRHYRMGKGSQRAASEGSKEVLPAATAATLAVIAVFLPVVFMSGVIGKFFFQFGVTMSAAVLLSLVEAVTITPMRAAAFLSSEPKVSKFEHWLDVKFEHFAHVYQGWLKKTLRWSKTVVIASLALFVVSMLLVKKVRQEFVPAQDQDFIIVAGQTPPGSSLPTTSEAAKKLEEIVRKEPGVQGFITSVGIGGLNTSVNQIAMPIALKPRAERDAGHMEIMNRLREKFKEVKNVRINMRDISARNLATGRLNPVAFNIRGPDLGVLSEKGQEIIKRLENENLAIDLDMDFRKGIPELEIEPNREAMTDRGVTADQVAKTLAVAIGSLRQGKYTADGHRYDIRFKVPDDMIQSPKDIEKMSVRNLYGNLVPMSQLVKFKEEGAIQSISRINRQRAISIFGNLGPGRSQADVLKQAEKIAYEVLPPGYSFALEGASAGFSEAFNSLIIAMLVGIIVAYMILAVQFNSFIHPIAVLIALPFSVTGALIALWVFGVSLNLFSFIGLIVLMGIAKKNSILLVEFTNQVREQGERDVLTALQNACPVRLRPILMTSVATVAAATPLILGHGLGVETRIPMGLSIIGGTIVSTLLTLFVVPSLYLNLEKLAHRVKRSRIDLKSMTAS